MVQTIFFSFLHLPRNFHAVLKKSNEIIMLYPSLFSPETDELRLTRDSKWFGKHDCLKQHIQHWHDINEILRVRTVNLLRKQDTASLSPAAASYYCWTLPSLTVPQLAASNSLSVWCSRSSHWLYQHRRFNSPWNFL
jgi:hypothetical protein